MSTRFLMLCCAVVAALTPGNVRAEVFVLSNGGRVEGEWINRGAEPLLMYEIATRSGGRLTLSSGQVEHVIVKSEAVLRYEAERPGVPDTIDGQWAMAERCRKADLQPQREMHLRRILELSPDHSDARHALGYSQVDGKWVKPDEWLSKQGYRRYKGSWRLPQEVELDAMHEQQQEEEVQWRKRIKRWRTAITRGRSTSQEALAGIKAIDSVYAVAALRDVLSDKDETKAMKLLYIDVLGRFNNANAGKALLERVMTDSDLEVRERSIAALKNHDTSQALAVLSHGLKHKDNQTVNIAGWALGKLGDPGAIPALIEAVVTKHKFKIYPGGTPGGINAGMGTGGGGLSMGGRPKIIERELRNPKVLAALTALTPDGVNFAFNKQAWKNWWAQEHSAPGVSLRRDL